jgi:hypothetical protein
LAADKPGIRTGLPRQLTLRDAPAEASMRSYICEEARQRAHYRTLREWVRLIRQASECGAKNAQHQIVDGLFDGKFAVRWEDQGKNPYCDPAGADLPPQKGAFWRKAQIAPRTYKVFDDLGVTEAGRAAGAAYWRVLLLAPRGGTEFESILRSSMRADSSSGDQAPNVLPLRTEAAISENAYLERRGRAGRKPGSGIIDDETALRRMLSLLAAGHVPSVNAAATAVARTGNPAHSVSADTTRLRTKFSRWQGGTEPPAGKTWSDVEDELQSN